MPYIRCRAAANAHLSMQPMIPLILETNALFLHTYLPHYTFQYAHVHIMEKKLEMKESSSSAIELPSAIVWLQLVMLRPVITQNNTI